MHFLFRILHVVKSDHQAAVESSVALLTHPINAYLLFLRFHIDWIDLMKYIGINNATVGQFTEDPFLSNISAILLI